MMSELGTVLKSKIPEPVRKLLTWLTDLLNLGRSAGLWQKKGGPSGFDGPDLDGPR